MESESHLAGRRAAYQIAVAVLLVAVTVGVAIYILFRTAHDLAGTRDAADIATGLGRLLLISAGAGVVASMILERWLDSFHVETRARWNRLMQLASSVIAAVLAGFAGAAADSRASVVVGLAAAGLVIGGPFAWTTRDIVRIIERRSST